MEYYIDSIYHDTISRYADTLKVTGPSAEERIRTKLYLNSLYGKMVSSIHFIDGKGINYDTDSTYYDIKKVSKYTDTLKVVRPTVEQRILTKLFLNSYYGKMVSSIHFIDGKGINNECGIQSDKLLRCSKNNRGRLFISNNMV